mmetsp:Transcript_23604/g.79302  ORF Transcript_23604/g.79302 Transcript_23604/m.79302 type:complete len:1055 (-) Transcript_23604:26-3190(-)
MRFVPSLRRRRSDRAPTSLVFITDPGPDPDDIKALLVAAALHKAGKANLLAVVANGGGQQVRHRARLARALLNHMHLDEVRVGVGSPGKDAMPEPHEYRLEGFEHVDDSTIENGHELLLQLLGSAPDKSLAFILISSLRDMADLMSEAPGLVLEKVASVHIMGGLQRDTLTGSLVPDTSQNNSFDMHAAEIAYGFCMDRGLPMTVISRHAVPRLPMQLARSFAERTPCPVMHYLADAQFKGLEGLWRRLCAGELPARCTKTWYAETFCGKEPGSEEARAFEDLSSDTPIGCRLDGHVKPYDVLALMTALPLTAPLFAAAAEVVEVRGVRHRLLLEQKQMIDGDHVHRLLRETYHEAVLSTTARDLSPTSVLPAPGTHSPTPRACPPAPPDELDAQVESCRSASAERRLEMGLPEISPVRRNVRQGLPRGGQGGDDDGAGHGPAALGLTPPRVSAMRRPPKLRLRSSLCATTLKFDRLGHVDSLPGGYSGGSLRRTFSFEFDHTYEKHIVARLSRALDEARAYQEQFLSTVAYVSGAAWLLCSSVAVTETGGGSGPVLDPRAPLPSRLATAMVLSAAAAQFTLIAVQPTRSNMSAMRGLACGLVLLLFGAAAGTAGAGLAATESGDQGAAAALALCAAGLTWRAVAATRHVYRRWNSGVRLKDEAWAVLGALTTAIGAVLVASAPGVDPCRTVRCAAAGLLIASFGAASSSPGVRRCMHAALARGLSDYGSYAPIAPLIGFGCVSGTMVEPDVLYDEAHRVFRPVVLDAAARARLEERLASQAAGVPAKHAPAVPRSAAGAPWRATAVAEWMGVAGCPTAPPAAPVPSRDDPCYLGFAGLPTPSSPSTSTPPLTPASDKLDLAAAPAFAPPPAPDVPQWRGSVDPGADYYVVHSWGDDPAIKAQAIRAWAARREVADGAAPTIWLDALCANPALGSTKCLSHMPINLAKCRKLLLCAGPSVVDCLRCVVELYCWSAMGGQLSDVDVVLVGGPADRDAIVASFDAFHVMYCESDPGEHELRMEHAVALATVARFNEQVRKYYRLVQDAVRRVKAEE